VASSRVRLGEMYQVLYDFFGPQHWWPGESKFEIIVGAVLAQNTSWNNVERAIVTLKEVGVLDLSKMSELPSGLLAEYIRPAGYYNLKAGRLTNLLTMINETFDGDVEAMCSESTSSLREHLLTVKGIGPETADSILLYGAGKPVFVVDAYTRRILLRHDFIDEEQGYYEIQELFTDNLAEDVYLFNEYHALLVRVAKTFCKKSKPLCDQCPLENLALSFC